MPDTENGKDLAPRDLESADEIQVSATVQPPETIEGWVWCGYAGHFIASNNCRLHLHTRIGSYRVSTVGDYWPPGATEAETIGLQRMFETYVFRVSGFGEHGEGVVDEFSEIDSNGYMKAEDAERGHMQMCLKYDRIAREEALNVH